MLIGPPSGAGWKEEWYHWPNEAETAATRAQGAAAADNVYFSAHLFATQNSSKAQVLPSRTIQADLDEGVAPANPAPTVLVETSPGRHQGYWVLAEPMSTEALEGLSRQLTYSIPDCDRSGWSLGHKMRVPGTINYKYSSGPKQVKVVGSLLTVYRSLPFAPQARVTEVPDQWTPEPLVEGVGVRELWATVKEVLPRRITAQYDRKQPDRSQALWALVQALFRAGCDRNQVFWIAEASANNKFKDNRYHAQMDLAKDILRAERSIAEGGPDTDDIKTRILEARRLPGLVAEKRSYIAAMVRDSLATQGMFVATSDGQEWYIREDNGRPLLLTGSNDYLNSLLEIRFGLNATEGETGYLIHNLISHTKERGTKGEMAVLSHYDRNAETLLIHSGRRDVLHVSADSISQSYNGSNGIVFPWRPNEEPFEPSFGQGGPAVLDRLFEGCFDNIEELEPRQALALLKAWLIFLLFRNEASARPVLALFGQPGSGKSTLFRRIYTFLYGRSKAVNSVTSSDDFDYAVASDPLVVFDNVDTFVSWLPDKLALSAASSDLIKRKLYTDSDTVIVKRQALVGLTAHNPRFRREDIVDRLIMLQFHRLDSFTSETQILDRIALQRDILWGSLIEAVQLVLKQPWPTEAETPQFRVNDFARIGMRIAQALGFAEDFVSALQVNIKEQVSFNLEEEDVLTDAIKTWMGSKFYTPTYWSTGELFTQWSALSRDPQSFTRFYRNSIVLGRKLWSLQETLGTLFDLTYQVENGIRSWRITSK